MDEINFDPFLAMVPDFRPYLNKNHKQASALKDRANKGGLLTLEASTAEEQKLHEQSQIAMKWQSGGLIGGKVKDDMAERSIFAERWERMVTSLLYMPSESTGKQSRASGRGPHSTISFRTADYK